MHQDQPTITHHSEKNCSHDNKIINMPPKRSKISIHKPHFCPKKYNQCNKITKIKRVNNESIGREEVYNGVCKIPSRRRSSTGEEDGRELVKLMKEKAAGDGWPLWQPAVVGGGVGREGMRRS